MRFALAHKSTSYLMVATSFLTLALSGELSMMLVAAAALAIVASWFSEPKKRRFQQAWTALTLIVFGYAALTLLTGGDILLTGTSFLIFLLIVKVFNRQRHADYLQIYVLTFLMMVAGTVLNAELAYGLLFLGYVIASTWALTLYHLRCELEAALLPSVSEERPGGQGVPMARIFQSRRIVGARFYVGTAIVSVAIFAFASVLFLAIPRVGFGVFFAKSRDNVTMAGFSDGVELGGHGLIKEDSTVVMRVQIADKYQGRRAPYIHWRGVAFDTYARGEWRRSKEAPDTARKIDYDGKNITHYLLYGDRRMRERELRRRAERHVKQDIYLEPLGYDVLFGASMPLAFSFEARWNERARAAKNDEIRQAHSSGIKYTVHSGLDAPSPEGLRAAEGEIPADYEVYLRVPDAVPARVAELAREITAGASTPYDRAAALVEWLQKLDYTLKLVEPPPGRDPVDFFLFDRRAGHCEYFSSALALMARSVGLPSRNVNGFLGGEWNEYDEYIAVRAGDAHSWVELYIPGHGWVTFDATPSANLDRLGRGRDGLMPRLRRLMDTMRFKWFKWVIEYDLQRQMGLFKKIGELFRGGAETMAKKEKRATQAWLKAHKVSLAGGLAAFAAAASLALLWRRRRRAAGIETADPHRRNPVRAAYLKSLRALARRGQKRDPSATPREFSDELSERGVPGAPALAELTSLYYQALYATEGSPDESARHRADELAAAVADANRRARRS